MLLPASPPAPPTPPAVRRGVDRAGGKGGAFGREQQVGATVGENNGDKVLRVGMKPFQAVFPPAKS